MPTFGIGDNTFDLDVEWDRLIKEGEEQAKKFTFKEEKKDDPRWMSFHLGGVYTAKRKDPSDPDSVDYEEAFRKKQEEIVRTTTDIIIQSMSEALLDEIIGELEDKDIFGDSISFESGDSSLRGKGITSIGGNAQGKGGEGARGGAYGNFIEDEMFGLTGTRHNLPASDLQGGLELKVRTLQPTNETAGDLGVGSITLYDIIESEFDTVTTRKKVALYKIAEKMRNLLLVVVTDEYEQGSATSKLHFRSIMLHTELLLEKLENMLEDSLTKKVRSYKPVKCTPGKWSGNKVSYTVEVNLGNINEILLWTRFYLMHHDILRQFSSNDGMRRNFFATIRDLKLKKLKDSDIKINLGGFLNDYI